MRQSNPDTIKSNPLIILMALRQHELLNRMNADEKEILAEMKKSMKYFMIIFVLFGLSAVAMALLTSWLK